MIRFDFSKDEFEYFKDQCPFTDEEVRVFEMRRRGKSVCCMAQELNVCERTIKRRVKSIHNKILKLI